MKASIAQGNSSVDPLRKNDLPVDYGDLEAPIHNALSSSLALTDWVEDNIAAVRERDGSGWRVIRLTEDQLKILFYLMYAVQGHARELSKLFHTAHEVQS